MKIVGVSGGSRILTEGYGNRWKNGWICFFEFTIKTSYKIILNKWSMTNDKYKKKRENAIVDFPDYQIPVTQLVEKRTQNFAIDVGNK